ncbi:endonuclease/exonuclease/phosphatase family protein [Halalkalibaculum sp. DA3122]|uniref:endonuclease/exonuclease/phosphatase family protein n=1 Tax=Halalkalibaculum sp. DA3122 TaxID=3373607 RepID=UPI00375538D1
MKSFSSPILLLVLMALLPVAGIGQSADTIKVMTYNIYHGEDPENPGSSNIEDVAMLIRNERPDFVALQEVDSLTGRSARLNNGVPQNLVEKLADLTGMHGYFGKAINFDGGGYGEGILTPHPVSVEKVMLPIPKGGEKRALLVARTELDEGGELLFAGTHLCHQYPENRAAQMQKINEFFSGADIPVILGGDLNFTPGSDPYNILRDQWIDMAQNVGLPEATYPYGDPEKRIDYLLVHAAMRDVVEVVDLRVLGVGYSDHLPVVATLKIYN